MSQIAFDSSSVKSFHMEGHEVTLDNIDIKITDFETKQNAFGENQLIVPITIKINENLNVAGDVYKIGKTLGFTLYRVRNFTMKLDLTIYDGENSVSEQLYGMGKYESAGMDCSHLDKSTFNQNLKTTYSSRTIELQRPNDILRIKGKITFKILLSEEIPIDSPDHDLKEETLTWKYLISNDAIENLKNEKNFIINCKGQ